MNNILNLLGFELLLILQYNKCCCCSGRSQGYIAQTVTKLKKRRDLVVKRLNEIDGISCKLPNGAFYTFPKILHNGWKDDKDFVLDLLDKTGILTVHGSGFGELGKGHFRIVYLPNEQILEQAMDKLAGFVNTRDRN